MIQARDILPRFVCIVSVTAFPIAGWGVVNLRTCLLRM